MYLCLLEVWVNETDCSLLLEVQSGLRAWPVIRLQATTLPVVNNEEGRRAQEQIQSGFSHKRSK